MKSMIRYGLLAIALICFSNMGIAQKKNKKKAKTTISAKKKKKSTKKTTTRKKQSVKKRPSVAIYKVVDTISPLRPITSLPFKNYTIDSIPEKVVTIVSAFKPQLKNVAKIGFLNATAVVDTNSVLLSYQVPSQNLSFQYQPIALVPRAIKIDSLNAIKQSANLKIGMGNYFNQFIQLEGALVDQKAQQHHVSILNESIAGPHPIQKWNSIGLNYNGSYSMNKNKVLNTQVYFNQSNRYRYGLVPDSTILPLKNFEQKLTVIGANFSLINNQVASDEFNYAPILKFNHSNLINQANNLVIDLYSPIMYSLKNSIKLHADFNFSYNQYNQVNKNSINNTIFQFDPSLELNKTQYRLNIGVRPTIANGDFALYPKIELTKKLKDTNYILDAGWNTSVNNNQLMQLIGQNHWISAPSSMPISSKENKYLNVQVTVSKRLNYGFNMALNDYRELPFFNQTKQMNNPIQEGLKFDVLFEKRAIAIELVGNLRYQFSDKILWKNNFKYIQFNLIRENTQAWGILPFEFNSQLNWVFNKKLLLDAAGQFWTGSKTSAGLGNAYQLNNTFVLNAGMQYTISDQWTFWGKGENLLDQQYQRWANYPSLGIQILAGIQYKFRK
ncbi:MAG: TonB-dependent receptor [Sediminibacterium sp.]|nr:TonB-dependent receptor [Sediminibacterium sp.]